MKYPSTDGTICTVRADQKMARECYVVGLRVQPLVHKREGKGKDVALADLDPRVDIEERMEPQEGTRPFSLGKWEGQNTSVATGLTTEQVNTVGFFIEKEP
ncbi:hypothetical protein LR48_Vigan01g052900 [Vigna angularis]|uniref:Uncharacterized protein n=1 Tax=Phaseolus angularis TaxID=3914 RepID=A0A0L9TLG7_PHAAN|nr:hypothetical protein LR48_Vigan01g052900 [Vigna angularis]